MSSRIVASSAAHAQELQAIRRHLGLSQRHFACLLALTPRSLCRWERGVKPVPLTVLRLARFLALSGTPPAQFISVRTDADQPRIALAHGEGCGWRSDACRGPWYTMEAHISRRRAVYAEACAVHLQQASEAVGFLIEHKWLPWRRHAQRQAKGTVPPS